MRREELYLADLIDNARAVRNYLDGVSRERWDSDQVLRDAVLYRMLRWEIASSLPDELRDRYPDVAWRQIRAFRNLAVHRYFGVDWAVAWKIAQDEPPVLEEQARAIMRAEFPNLAKPTSHRNQLENRQTPNHAARRRTLSATPKVRQRRRPRHSRDMAPATCSGQIALQGRHDCALG